MKKIGNKTIKIFGIGAVVLFVLMSVTPAVSALAKPDYEKTVTKYFYDENGRLTHEHTEHWEDGKLVWSEDTIYEYDEEGRLISKITTRVNW